MVNTVRMYFGTDEGKTTMISIPRADVEVLDETVASAMTGIIDQAIVSTTVGNLIGAERAELMQKDVYEYRFD